MTNVLSPVLIVAIILIIFLGVVVLMLLKANQSSKVTEESVDSTTRKLPYAIREDFLTAAEFSFYKVLNNALDDHYLICPKVNLGDLFFVSKVGNKSERMSYRNKINRKHVDFLVVDSKTMVVAFGIELDDSSHQKAKRVERDVFVNQVFKDAGLPLVRIVAKQGYVASEVLTSIESQVAVRNTEYAAVEEAEAKEPDAKICERCGAKMVKRVAKKGKNEGKSFWGCTNYPKCRFVVEE